MSSMMNAIEIQNQSLVPCQRSLPEPSQGEILIKVHAAGVNRPDVLQRLGHYPPPTGITDIPGLEISGTVQTNGKRFKKGDTVCALIAGGGYAEYVTVPECQCLPKPENLSFEAAAALPECVFTVWNNLFHIGKLQAGETALIHGGSSGIGTFAIQMTLARGARVYATAGSDDKCTACEKLGATAINYKEQDFSELITDGVDVVLDMVGGDYMNKNLRLLKENGRHVSIAFLRGKKAEIDITQIMRKKLTVTGSTLRARPIEEKAALAATIEKEIWPLIIKEKITPIIDNIYPLKDAWKAHVRMESSKHIGKIVLKVL